MQHIQDEGSGESFEEVIVATTGKDRKQLPGYEWGWRYRWEVARTWDALTCSVTMGNYASGMPARTHMPAK